VDCIRSCGWRGGYPAAAVRHFRGHHDDGREPEFAGKPIDQDGDDDGAFAVHLANRAGPQRQEVCGGEAVDVARDA
jgi:hypothetical protein